jgi:nucleolar protein 56
MFLFKSILLFRQFSVNSFKMKSLQGYTMKYYLISKWFGCFLLNENGQIIEQELFCQNKEELIDSFSQIRQGCILEKERRLSGKYSPLVAEKRLQSIGFFHPDEEIFSSFQIKPESFGCSKEMLHSLLCSITENEVYNALCNEDYQVIQQVNALDEIQHMANVLSERIAAWNIYPNNEEYQIPLRRVIDHIEKNQDLLKQQIETTVSNIAPNICELIGPMIAARLLSHAGSLRKLAMLPSSSIQLLGAEKALFRFKKQGGKPPKHGVIYQHPLISKVPYNQRGKNARLLSAKISIAAKADMFTKRYIAPMLKARLSEQIKNK